MKPIYLDHNATSPVHADILAELPLFLSDAWGNPSSIHRFGRKPKEVLREARRRLAETFRVQPVEIVFTSGGSEGNNLVIKGVFDYFQKNQPKRNHFISTEIEHPSVKKTLEELRSKGAKVDFISVSRSGELNLSELSRKLDPDTTALVSVMYANNETGLLLPVKKIAELVTSKGILMHSDCVQVLGKQPLDLKNLNLDFATFSAHKAYALKGSGFLYIKKSAPFVPQILGGAQERTRRAGTENVLGIFALLLMTKYLAQDVYLLEQKERTKKLRDFFESEVTKRISGVVINHQDAPRLTNTSSLILDGVDGESLLMSLDIAGFGVSTGAACSSGSPEPSPVLLALGLSRSEAQSSLRVSLGWGTSHQDIQHFLSVLEERVEHLRKIKTMYGEQKA